MFNIDKSWCSVLENEFKKIYFKNIINFINSEKKKKCILPENPEILNCLKFTPLNKIKVVIIGQDPYCLENQATGLAFSVPKNEKIPSSLKNIYLELNYDLGIKIPKSGCLIKWAEQGVLLLNTILTVEKNKPGSHAGIGWEILTDHIIKTISNKKNKTIFVLWGKYALEKKNILNYKDDILIHSSHPSSFSANKGFFGSRPFSKINLHLKLIGKKEIDWNID